MAELGERRAAHYRAAPGEPHNGGLPLPLVRELGVTGVPFFIFGGRVAMSGAQEAETLVGAMADAAKGAAD